MASDKEIDLVCEIQRLAIRINMQGAYHVHTEFSGHVRGFYVYMHDAKTGKITDKFATHDHHVYLSAASAPPYGEVVELIVMDKVDQLEKLKAHLSKFSSGEVAQ